MKKIVTIMASHLSPYPGSASNLPEKFIRSVNSFIKQTYSNKELIIISDGCEITTDLFNIWFSNYNNIKLISLSKQPKFSSVVRQSGIDSLNNEDCIICYLDVDDEFIGNHLNNIINQFTDDLEFVYYNDFLSYQPIYHERNVQLKPAQIGTSTIAHKNKSYYKWTSNRYGHDWDFINEYLIPNSNNKYKKINNCGYLVHHIPNILDN